MQNIPFFLGAYWGARQESIDQCALRLERMFSRLPHGDSRFATWYEHTASRKQALQRPASVGSRVYWIGLLNRCRIVNDDKNVVEDAGFLISLWNGLDKDKSVTLTISCGSFSKWLGNNVAIDLPDNLSELRQTERMSDVLTAVVEAWEPEWAGVMSRSAMDARDFAASKPFVDWMLYLSNQLAPQIPKLPQPARAQQVGKIGSIIVVQPEPPAPANPDHLKNIQQADEALHAV